MFYKYWRQLKTLFIISSGLGVFIVIYFFTKMDQVVALHFGFKGYADNWMSNEAYLFFNVGLFLFLLIVFLGVTWVVNTSSAAFFNVPDRDYWLRKENLPVLKQTVSGVLFAIGIITNLLFIGVNYQIYQADMLTPNKMDMGFFTIMLLMYGVLLVLIIIGMYTALHRKEVKPDA